MSVNVPMEPDFSARKVRIAAVCLIGMAFGTYMVVFSAMSFLLLPITKEFHWTRLEFSYGTTILMWSGAIMMPLLGRMTDRFGVRYVAVVATTMLGISTVLIGRQTGGAWTYYLSVALAGAFGPTTIIYNKVVAGLFTQNRGKALGMFYVLTTPISALMPQITTRLLNHFGWRGVFTVYGFVAFAIVPLLYFGLEEPGRSAPGGLLGRLRMGRLAALQGTPAALVGMTAGEARKCKTFWILVAISISASALHMGWIQHNVSYLIGRGFTQRQIANCLSISFLFVPVASFLGGYVLDRVHTPKIAAPFALLGTIGTVCWWLAWPNFGGTRMVFAGMILVSSALASAAPIQIYFFTRYFGLKAFAEIFGLLLGIQSLVYGIGPPIIGALFDRTGSYNVVLLMLTIGYAVSTALILTLGPYRYDLDLREPTTAAAAEEKAASIPAVAGGA